MTYPEIPGPPGRRLVSPQPAYAPTVSADEAGGHGNIAPFAMLGAAYGACATMAGVLNVKPGQDRISCVPVIGIDPVNGWVLMTYDEEDGDGFRRPGYVARSVERDVLLPLSRFRFTPTQTRFAWIVRNGFPAGPLGPWTDSEIDHRTRQDRNVA